MWTFHLKSDDIVTPRYFVDVKSKRKRERIQGTSKTYDGIHMYYMGSLSKKITGIALKWYKDM
jgi:hypothetical protein